MNLYKEVISCYKQQRCLYRKAPYIHVLLKEFLMKHVFTIVDPNVIQKVESSGKYILTYKEPDTTYLNIHELRKEMGSPNLDLCTEEIEEIPYLVSLSDRKIPITFFPNSK